MPAIRRQDVEQNLEALRRDGCRQRLEGVAADHEITAHRIAQADAEHAPHQGIRPSAQFGAERRQPVRGAAIQVAAGHDEIGIFRTQLAQHGEEQRLVVLQVGVHDGEIARLAAEHAFEAGAGKAAAADAAYAAHAAIGFADRTRHRSGAVGRAVVDEDDFPVAAVKNLAQPLDQDRNVGPLVERRHHDAKLWCRLRRQRGPGARQNGRGCNIHRARSVPDPKSKPRGDISWLFIHPSNGQHKVKHLPARPESA